MSHLYRGVSRKLDEQNNGALRPNGNKSRVAMYYSDKGLRYDGKFTHGESENNAARAHQVESGMREGCFVSTTRNCEIAEFFATSDSTGSRIDGYVYVIDEEKLDSFGVKAWEFKDAEHLEHFEVSLRAHNNGDLPIEVIVEKYEVYAEGCSNRRRRDV